MYLLYFLKGDLFWKGIPLSISSRISLEDFFLSFLILPKIKHWRKETFSRMDQNIYYTLQILSPTQIHSGKCGKSTVREQGNHKLKYQMIWKQQKLNVVLNLYSIYLCFTLETGATEAFVVSSTNPSTNKNVRKLSIFYMCILCHAQTGNWITCNSKYYY